MIIIIMIVTTIIHTPDSVRDLAFDFAGCFRPGGAVVIVDE